MRRRFLIIVSVLTGIAVVVTVVANPLVATLLRSERHALLSDRIMLITLREQDTSALSTFPVNYLRETDTVYIGCDSGWWKHLEGGAEVRMRIKDSDLVGWATPILNNRDRISEGFKKLRPSTYQWALWTGAVFIEVQIQKGTTQPIVLPDRGHAAVLDEGERFCLGCGGRPRQAAQGGKKEGRKRG